MPGLLAQYLLLTTSKTLTAQEFNATLHQTRPQPGKQPTKRNHKHQVPTFCKLSFSSSSFFKTQGQTDIRIMPLVVLRLISH